MPGWHCTSTPGDAGGHQGHHHRDVTPRARPPSDTAYLASKPVVVVPVDLPPGQGPFPLWEEIPGRRGQVMSTMQRVKTGPNMAQHIGGPKKITTTHWKFNMAPEILQFQKESSLPTIRGYVKFPGLRRTVCWNCSWNKPLRKKKKTL